MIAAPDRLAVHYRSESPEWYTPPAVIDLVLRVLGTIDLLVAGVRPAQPGAAHHGTGPAAGGAGLRGRQ